MKAYLKHLYLLIFLFAKNIFCEAQINLVQNPSFESYTACPNSSNIDGAIGWMNFGGTPDYFNACATITDVAVPSNYVGYQNAYDGSAYAGIVTYYTSASSREFLSTQLTQTLSIGNKYYVSCYISRADSIPQACAANKFGFRFSTNLFDYTNPVPVDNFSHIHSNNIINDSLGWTKISGSFIADSLYKFLIIGNFYDNVSTNAIQCNTSPSLAYYYLDKVCVSTDSTTCNVNTGININENYSNLIIYPNPATNNITVRCFSFFNPYKIAIYDSFGQEKKKYKVNTENEQIDISDIPTGIYILRVFLNNQVTNYKLIKQ